MQHPDLKGLVWGRHLQRLLSACGIALSAPEPAPRVVGHVPPWFQRLGAVLTLVGLVGGIRAVDRALSPHPSPSVHEAEVGTLDAGAWNQWIGGALPLRLGQTAGERARPAATLQVSLQDPDSVADTQRAAAPAGMAASRPDPHRFQRIEVTAYSTRTDAADGTGTLTATHTRATAGTLALSRDLIRTFTRGAPFEFGDKVLIPGVGIFEVRDTMNPRWAGKADIWLDSPEKARQWGCRTVFVTRLDEDTPVAPPAIH